MQSRSPTQAEVLNRWLDACQRLIRVCLPAVVENYDPSTQTADVRPLVADQYLDADGVRQVEALPVLSGVPVEFPGGGGMILTFPLQPGDTGKVTFCDRSIDEWKTQGGDQAPAAGRRHHLTDAIFAPTLRPLSNPRASASPTLVAVGQDGALPDFAALASKVLAELSSIVSGYNLHVHTSAASGSPTSPPTVPLSNPSSVASGSLEVLG